MQDVRYNWIPKKKSGTTEILMKNVKYNWIPNEHERKNWIRKEIPRFCSDVRGWGASRGEKNRQRPEKSTMSIFSSQQTRGEKNRRRPEKSIIRIFAQAGRAGAKKSADGRKILNQNLLVQL